jgi:hypothetical protein
VQRISWRNSVEYDMGNRRIHTFAMISHEVTAETTKSSNQEKKMRFSTHMPWSTAMNVPVRPIPALQCTIHGWAGSLLHERTACVSRCACV